MENLSQNESNNYEKITGIETLKVGQKIIVLEDFKAGDWSGTTNRKGIIPAGTVCEISDIWYFDRYILELKLPLGLAQVAGHGWGVDSPNTEHGTIDIEFEDISIGLVQD
jgi:hypothetical protein